MLMPNHLIRYPYYVHEYEVFLTERWGLFPIAHRWHYFWGLSEEKEKPWALPACTCTYHERGDFFCLFSSSSSAGLLSLVFTSPQARIHSTSTHSHLPGQSALSVWLPGSPSSATSIECEFSKIDLAEPYILSPPLLGSFWFQAWIISIIQILAATHSTECGWRNLWNHADQILLWMSDAPTLLFTFLPMPCHCSNALITVKSPDSSGDPSKHNIIL